MRKRTYIDDGGQPCHALEFSDQKERDRVERIVKAWEGRIELLFQLGRELSDNGKSLCEFDNLSSFAEGRVRTHVGLQIMEWGECLLFEAKEHPMNKHLQQLNEMVETVKDVLADDEEFQATLAKMEAKKSQ